MLSSACSLRSAQCAALIALAAVAGISRFAPSSSSQPDTRRDAPSASVTAPRPQPHLHPCVLLAHFVRCCRHAFFTSAPAPITPEELPAPVANLPLHTSAPGADPAPSWTAALAANPRSFAHAADVSPLSVRRHVIPFAVGPPAPTPPPPHRADGTSVRHDVSARCLRFPSVVIVRLFPVARLARRRFSGQPWAARPLLLRSALRGEPAPLPTPVRFPPPRGASGRRGPHPCTFSR